MTDYGKRIRVTIVADGSFATYWGDTGERVAPHAAFAHGRCGSPAEFAGRVSAKAVGATVVSVGRDEVRWTR